ncbi:agmatine deiminase [Enterococcus sp. PF1-24]|uniref:agmatine deiminase family protein n=1 Tax=unclassified Enterococcus TaxID=2608891 RepID=UPI002475D1B3|nr:MULTISPECIES: agmatine deiminase family protein [unclassified Enterococcus]MDH6363495.1 agmatine deiminase [Enterococcus sp. PFB1-1]MDH6400589.1 agmatine deiminase [Enterococcus sp. PF1-24]
MSTLNYKNLDYKDFRFPGEFEPQEAVIIGWPEMAECVKGYSLHQAFAQLIKIIVEEATGITLYVNCPKEEMLISCKATLEKESVDLKKIVFTSYPDGSNWTRDYGPDMMVDDQGNKVLANPEFNMYGQSTIDSVTSQLCARFGPHLALEMGYRDFVNSSLITEGGDKEFNGKGVLMALRDTEVTKRNPEMTTKEVETEMKRLFNLERIIWLEKGVFDDELTTSGVLDYVDGVPVYRSSSANGHIDEFCRFVGHNTIILAEVTEEEASTLNSHRITKERLDEAYEVLSKATDVNGEPFKIIRMPVPEPFYIHTKKGDWINDTWTCRYGEGGDFLDDGTPMPHGDMVMQPALSYCNFLILNNIVIAQSYWEEGKPESIKKLDAKAIDVLQEAFPDRKIIPFVSTALNIRGGGVHCATKNVPKAKK